MKTNCKNCGKEFRTFPCYIKEGRGIYCSIECRSKSQEFIKKIHTEAIHKKIGDKQRGKPRKSITGKKHYLWQGEQVKYRPLHAWVERHKGKPDTCEHCGKKGLKGRQIAWANKSGKYKRILSDWIRLCKKCHGAYDAQKRRSVII